MTSATTIDGSNAPAPRGGAVALAVAAGVAGLLLVRLRARIGPWVALHGWLDGLGVPAAIRGLDVPVVMVAAALLGARLATGRGRALAALGLRAPIGRGLAFGLVAAAPMIAQAPFSANGFALDAVVLRNVLAMPFAEEVVFRGLFVALPVAALGARFWPCAVLAGVAFGALHVSWSRAPDLGDLAVVGVTGAGGVWFAWLCRCLGWNLWAVWALHAGMNAAWLVFAVAADAAGGLWPNVGRAATIALGTVLALRARRHGGTAAAG